jgi:hypothetical protein
MRLLFIFLSTFIASATFIILVIYIGITRKPYPTSAGVDERGLAYILLLGMNMLLSSASSSMFLNFIGRVRNNYSYSFLSFFALPTIIAIYFLSPTHASLAMNSVVFIPFFSVLIVNFIFYRKYVRKKLIVSAEISRCQ